MGRKVVADALAYMLGRAATAEEVDQVLSGEAPSKSGFLRC
jgi:hypothetical protein